MSDFEVFPRRQLGRAGGPPLIRVSNHGDLILTVAAAALLHDCTHVQLLHNPETGDIALRPTQKDNPQAYSVRKNSKTGRAISARAFVHHLGLPAGATFSCEAQDGLLLGHREEEPS